MAVNGRRKGKDAENEFARLCKEHGYDVRRTQQYCGNTGEAADVVGLSNIHVEVKRVEQLNIHKAMDQAVRDSEAENKGNIPIVAHRRNRTPWLITMRAEDWFQMYGLSDISDRDELDEVSET